MIIKACARLGCAPWHPEWFFEMTPVDFLVKAITKISEDPRHLGRVYNVVQQDPSPLTKSSPTWRTTDTWQTALH